MIGINTNSGSLIVQSNLSKSTLGLQQAIERMTTGFKINHAKDNAAGYSIVTNMTTKIGAYEVAENNALMGLDMIKTASASLSQMSDILSRLRALGTQALNGTYGNSSIDAITNEANALINELYRIKGSTEYNGQNLFSSTSSVTNEGKKLSLNSDGFLQSITRRDTSALTAFSSVNENTTINGGTYSVSTAEELAKLARMVNSGKVTDIEIVLANDIDLSAYSTGTGWTPIGTSTSQFIGSIDGNGYTISNLYINSKNQGQAFIGFLKSGSIIQNIKFENANVTGGRYSAIVAGYGDGSSITNCSVKGIINGTMGVGGIIGSGYGMKTSHCYADVQVISTNSFAGGIAGDNNYGSSQFCISTGTISGVERVGGIAGSGSVFNCSSSAYVNGTDSVGGIAGTESTVSATYDNYFTGVVSGDSNVGGITGKAGATGYTALRNNIVLGKISGNTNVGVMTGAASATGAVLNNNYYDGNLTAGLSLIGNPDAASYTGSGNMDLTMGTIFGLQVGINSSDSSRLIYSTDISLPGLDSLMAGGIASQDFLKNIDESIRAIEIKQTEFGAAENRLESVLEEISIQYENLVSSRSTIQDADIAEVSSEYIKMQILQNASATLLATANQTPEIALRLLATGINT